MSDIVARKYYDEMKSQRDELLSALKEIIPAQDNADDCAAARESELLSNDRCDPQTSEYFRSAKIRLMKARETARTVIAKAGHE